ncbi:MAG: type II/IV secretion system protein [Anaplasmataceae bacterium]|nr:type II/IV secretion system protein [Anaplasmataceae bacterium]
MRDLKSLKTLIEGQLLKPLEEISIIKLVDYFVEYAYVSHSSDIHIEPGIDKVRVRFRIDGQLKDIFEGIAISKELQSEIITRIKVLSGLRTDEHSRPQDGRFRVNLEEVGDIDVRVSITPTYHGENSVMRVLVPTQNFRLEDLGFSDDDLKKVKRALSRPYGMLLANGPTGSGKTTTLYTMLKTVNRPDISIVTIEDPIEYSFEGASQLQVNNALGLTFASGLRSILRQDPNVIMVGEIRDEETANIAVQAALTGHLLFSTLHTNDAPTTFPRLMDMGVPPFLIASTVNIAIGQRLIRTICSTCKVERKMTNDEKKALAEIIPDVDLLGDKFFRGKGCEDCHETGYRGRTAIREVLEVDETIQDLIMKRASAADIKDAAIANGMKTMFQNGLDLVQSGKVSIEELVRIIHE